LFGGVHKLRLESGQEVKIGVLDIVVDGVELFEAFEDPFDPAIYLGAFDKCEHNRDVPYWGFEAWYSLVGHHVYPKFSNKAIGLGSIAVKE